MKINENSIVSNICGIKSNIKLFELCEYLEISDEIDEVVEYLNDGEDFEIVMAINPQSFLSISRDWPFEQPLIDFGEVVENPGFWIRQTDGSLVNCDPGGYEH